MSYSLQFVTFHRRRLIMKSFLGLPLLPALAWASPLFSTQTIHKEAAPILSSTNADAVPNSYIVVFKDHVTHGGANAHHAWVQDLHSVKMDLRKRSQIPFFDDIFHGLKHTYNIAGSLRGYSGHFDESVVEEIRRHPDVSARHFSVICSSYMS